MNLYLLDFGDIDVVLSRLIPPGEKGTSFAVLFKVQKGLPWLSDDEHQELLEMQQAVSIAVENLANFLRAENLVSGDRSHDNRVIVSPAILKRLRILCSITIEAIGDAESLEEPYKTETAREWQSRGLWGRLPELRALAAQLEQQTEINYLPVFLETLRDD